MAQLKHPYYTFVRHSAFYRDEPGFKAAVEPRALSTMEELMQVAKAGGLIFSSSPAAESAEATENYPPGTRGIIPQARGTFSETALDGQHIYVPAK